MEVSSISSVSASASALLAANAENAIRSLESQTRDLTQQIDATFQDAQLDAKTKLSKQQALRARLDQVQQQLAQARADDARATQPSFRPASSAIMTTLDAKARALAAARRGGVDIYA